MPNKVSVDNLASEIAKMLQEYKEDIEDDVKECTDKVIKEAKKELTIISPRSKKDVHLKGGAIHKAGAYSKGWTSKISQNKANKYHKVIWNKTDYRLTHLLEFGHANRDGSRTKPIPHIRPTEEKYRVEFTDLVPERIRRKK